MIPMNIFIFSSAKKGLSFVSIGSPLVLSALQLRPMLRLEGVKGNGNGPLREIRPPGHIETLLMDGMRLASIVLPVFLGRMHASRALPL